MSDENGNDGEEPGAIDFFFNMLGHLGRAQKKANAEKPVKGKRKMKVIAFDEAPADVEKPCCTAKRGE